MYDQVPSRVIKDPADLPARTGPRPNTDKRPPHSQIDQLVETAERRVLSGLLAAKIAQLPDVITGGSRRAPPGTTGFHMSTHPPSCAERAFLLGAEFAHVHTDDDGSLHTVLPEPLRSAAIERKWAEPHPLAGMPTVSPDTVMLYAPRDLDEVAIIVALVRCAWQNAVEAATKEA